MKLLQNPPPEVDLSKVMRNILAEKPRVTRFPIPWDQPDPPATTTETENNTNNNNNNVAMEEESLPMEVMSS